MIELGFNPGRLAPGLYLKVLCYIALQICIFHWSVPEAFIPTPRSSLLHFNLKKRQNNLNLLPKPFFPLRGRVLSEWMETKRGALRQRLPYSLAEAGFRNGMNSACISWWHRALSASRGDKIRHMFGYIYSLSFSPLSLLSPSPPPSLSPSLILSPCCIAATKCRSINYALWPPEVVAHSALSQSIPSPLKEARTLLLMAMDSGALCYVVPLSTREVASLSTC